MSSKPIDDIDLGPELVRGNWAQAAVAIVIVLLRVIAQYRIRRLKLDDYLMVFTLFASLTGSCMITLSVRHGLGRHIITLDPPERAQAIMYDYFAQAFGVGAAALGRVSFILFIMNLLGAKKIYRLILWAFLSLQLATNFVCILLIFIQCPGHTSAVWDKSQDVYCWSPLLQANYGYFQGSFNTLTDFYLAVFPTIVFWNLNMQLRIKAGLVILLSLAIFAMAASLVKTIQLRVLASTTDPTVDTVVLVRWLYIETYLVIITASIPCVKSLVMGTNTMSGSKPYNSYRMYGGSRGPRSGLSNNHNATSYGRKTDSARSDGGSEQNILYDEQPVGGITKQTDVFISVDNSDGTRVS